MDQEAGTSGNVTKTNMAALQHQFAKLMGVVQEEH
jgi:hypothetical protein